MQNRSDAEFRIYFSAKKKISIDPVRLFPLNNNQPVDLINAQKQNEECIKISLE